LSSLMGASSKSFLNLCKCAESLFTCSLHKSAYSSPAL
jgi:hypothetical protein